MLEQYKKVAVLGAGVSNKPLIAMLQAEKIEHRVFDKSENENYLDMMLDYAPEVIFRSPGVKPFEPQVIDAVKAGACLISEMELFLDRCPCAVYAVTGSDGKTTTTTILSELLRKTGKIVWLGGNIGTPLLEKLPRIKPDDFAVVELSSFQLMTMKKGKRTGIITNLTPNHLDWHRSFDEYVEAKLNIAENPIMNADDAGSIAAAEKYGLKPQKWFSKNDNLIDPSIILIPGAHNFENFTAAIAAVGDLVKKADIEDVARNFKGVKHRLELVCEKNGVRFYNDSIASTPTRTLAGLKTFSRKVILIAGGKPKVPFDAIAEVIGDYAKTVLTIGVSSDEIARVFDGKATVIPCGDMDRAVEKAKGIARDGDCVVLSPMCTSFDQFKNFEERGEVFCRAVERT